VYAFGSVWVTNALDASVTEIDSDTNQVAHVVPVGTSPTGIAAGAGYLWVTNQGDGTVTRFDPRTRVKDSPIKVGTGPVGIAVAGGAAWVANNLEGSLSRIDVEDLSVTARTLVKGGGAYGVAASSEVVWVSNEHGGTLMRVTTARDFRLAETVRLAGAPLGLAFVGDDLWFTSAAGGAALHRGGVLTAVGPAIDLSGIDATALDPTIGYDPVSLRLAQLTNDGLVGLRRAAGVQGTALVADLAASVPDPTDGGLTYTFHLRKGVRYATGAPVLAGDIRRGIERTVMHSGSPGYGYYGAIVGGTACKRAADRAVAAERPLPDCDLREGIVADDETGTVTFHLTRPTPEFIYQLTLASAIAVPQDTPTELPPGQFLPATGPYMVQSYVRIQDAADGHGRLELVRNPHFREWSRAAQPDGYPDRIIIDTGYTQQESVARVVDGRADLLWPGVESTDVERLRTRYGSQLHTNAGIFVHYVFLNTTKPPFDSRDARRAVAFALDRGRLARGFGGGTITCQLVPPDFAGHRPYCPFTVGRVGQGTWSGPDLAKGRDLVRRSGTRGAAVVVVASEYPTLAKAGRRVEQLLDSVGYRASLRLLDESDFFGTVFDPRRDLNAGLASWGADYPTAASYLVPMAACSDDLGGWNLSGRCNRALDARMAAAAEQQISDLAGANDAWAAIDRDVVGAAATIPYMVQPHQDFVSSRVGNAPVHFLSGPLVAQMWVH
jgi:peptide/nickel transport system substrate-binding protein